VHLCLLARYIRIKRRNQTYCLLCDESDSIATVQTKLAGILQQHPVPGYTTTPESTDPNTNMKLLYEGKPLLHDTLKKCDIKDGAVLQLVFAIGDDDDDDDNDEYEQVNIASTDLSEPAAVTATS
jgi:superfamily II DNA or RNA helicase